MEAKKASLSFAVESFDVPGCACDSNKDLVRQDTLNERRRTQHLEDGDRHFACDDAPSCSYVGSKTFMLRSSLDMQKCIQHGAENRKRSFPCDVPGCSLTPVTSWAPKSVGKAWHWLQETLPTWSIRPKRKEVVHVQPGIPVASIEGIPLSVEEFDSIGSLATTQSNEVKIRKSPDEAHWRGCKYRRQVETTEITVDPWKVMFSKPCICDRFSCGRSLKDTIAALHKGDIAVHDIPKITVTQLRGRIVTLDHRRLYCFRAALPKGTTIPVMLLKTTWLAHRYIAPNSKMYSAVRVDREHLKNAERECVWY